jgi:hypothetical protein
MCNTTERALPTMVKDDGDIDKLIELARLRLERQRWNGEKDESERQKVLERMEIEKQELEAKEAQYKRDIEQERDLAYHKWMIYTVMSDPKRNSFCVSMEAKNCYALLKMWIQRRQCEFKDYYYQDDIAHLKEELHQLEHEKKTIEKQLRAKLTRVEDQNSSQREDMYEALHSEQQKLLSMQRRNKFRKTKNEKSVCFPVPETIELTPWPSPPRRASSFHGIIESRISIPSTM